MIWNTSFYHPRIFRVAILSGYILLIFAFFSKMTVLNFVAVLFLVFVLLPKIYLRIISHKLILTNTKHRIKLFINDTGQFSFELINTSILPVFSATLNFNIDDYLECTSHKKQFGNYVFAFSIMPYSKATIEIPFKAHTRGFAKVKNVYIIVHDPFKIQKMKLDLNQFYKTDMIIYPNANTVNGLENLVTMEEGMIERPYALFQDMTAMSGTRNYMPGDPFKHIHWKATARSGQLQTKTYEKTVGMTWSVILMFNPSVYELTKQAEVEALISRAAFICQTARRLKINIELFTNIKPPGSDKIFYIPADRTVSHHAKLMELLAMIQGYQIKSTILTSMREIDRRLSYPRQLFFLQPINLVEGSHYFLHKWHKSGHRMYSVNESKELAFIKPLVKEGA